MYRLTRGYFAVIIVLLAAAAGGAQDHEQDAEWLIDVLELEEGSVVADIGAGEGEVTLALAPYIGSGGRIYSTELGSESVEELREAVEAAELSNIRVVEGKPNATSLPEECCDAVFMRRVYHHIGDPASMNESLFETLKPGGRIAVIDFVPRGSESEDPEDRSEGDQHGVTAETVAEELKRAGFEIISSERRSGRNIYVVARRPRDQ